MDSKTNKNSKKRVAIFKRPFIYRAMAVVLSLLMLMSTGILTQISAFAASVQPINLEDYLTDDTTLEITVYIDGVKHSYTPEELANKGLEVPKGAPVKVELYFNTIPSVKKGQTLVYQLPENLLDYSGANELGYVWQDTVWEENSAGAEVEAADWVIDKNGTLTVTLRDDFFESNKHDDNTLDLFGFNIKFSGSLSSERGEHSGNGDNVISFRGSTNGTGKISFTIPFEYRNEHANAEVEKKLTKFDVTTRTASYEIRVTAPASNTYLAKNVVVTDEILCDSKYIETVKNYYGTDTQQVYRNYVATTGSSTFDNKTGIWTIGDMEPGQVETLTYDIVISEDSYKDGALDKIQNVATATFNDDGENQSYSTLKLPSTVINKVLNQDENGNQMTTENGEVYLTYTLTATAYGGDESEITVKDAFTTADRITKIVVPDGGASQGSVTISNSMKILTWDVGDLKKGETATLTYRAYLDPSVWQISEDTKNPGTVSLKINNSVSLYVGSDGDTLTTPTDTDSTSNDLRKIWVNKGGSLITDTKDSKYGKMKYIVKVNGDPVVSNIKTIYDVLTGGTYESGGNLEITRYTSSDKSHLVDTTTIPLSEIVSTTDDGYRWDIDLVSRGLNGPYYYEIVYYVESSNVQVSNSAGIGFGVGPGYGVAAQVQGAGGMTYGTDYWKSFDKYDNKKESYSQWYVTVQKTVPKGAVYVDWLSSTYVYQFEQFWFDDDTLNDITITFDGNTLVQGTDYTVVGERYDNSWSRKTDPDGKRYYRFKITFNNEYLATSSKKMLISYKVRINNIARDEDDSSLASGMLPLFYNYCQWYLPEYGNLVPTNQGANYSHSNYETNTPLKKSDSTYNETDGTITWYLTVNTKSSVGGDATLIEYLPEGLDFVSAEISARAFPVTSKDTALGDITQEKYTNSSGVECTKVTIPIKNLTAYIVQSSRYKNENNPDGIGDTDYWSRAGEVTIKVVTKADVAWRLNLASDTTVTNKAVLTDNPYLPTGGVSATGTAVVPATQQVDKSMVGRDIPAYVQYALDVNSEGRSLIPGEGDTLEIIDIMGAGMSLSTTHTNSFKVYDVTNVANLLDSDGNVVVSQAQTGEDITAECTIKNVTGQKYNGMTDDEVGMPAYLITVPDGKHIAVVYWATFEGSDGESVTISNRASFLYGANLQSDSGDETSYPVVASESSSSLFVGPFFYLDKTDQWGNAVKDVTYTLYEVSVDSSGNETGRTALMTKTTDGEEPLYFGHRSTDGSSVPQLYKNKLYCLVEESAPAGYAIDSEPYYFEFKEKDHDIVDHPSGVTLHQFISGGTYSFVNQFEAASYSVPVKKTINGKSIVSDTVFSFNLKQDVTDTNAVYVDDTYTTLLSTKGITATVAGSGETLFAPLYFTNVGTYTFVVTEDDLSTEAANNGYTKDSNIYTVTIVVGKGANNDLVVESATFTSLNSSGTNGDLSTAVPTFDNGSHLTGTITLNATKEVTNRAKAVQAGEFAFTVSVGGEVVAETNADGTTKIGTDGKPVKKLFYTQEGGNIVINIDVDQDDVGTQTYIISEVEGSDPTIKYSTERVRVRVTIAEVGNGRVAATNYEYLTDSVFTNEYKAEGSVVLEGTKVLKNKYTGGTASVYQGEFNFIVKEGDTQVAKGTNEADGSITFTAITYDASDIGVHTYTISEKNEGLAFVEYTEQTVTVQVTVTDAGDGKLATSVQYVSGTLDDNGHALFVNEFTRAVPTGISIDSLPYIIILVLALCFCAIIIIRRRKMDMG